jgi:ketosteroid isomerase-like protein
MCNRTVLTAWLVLTTACTAGPAVEQAAAPPAAPDTAAIRAELEASMDQTEARYMAGDAAGVAGSYADSAIAEFQGFPSALGRPAIDSTFARFFASNKIKVAEITMTSVDVTSAMSATATGTYHSFGDVDGKPLHQWWRWVGAYEKQPDGQWKTSYIMAFADSTK